jgi:hypothetical protein
MNCACFWVSFALAEETRKIADHEVSVHVEWLNL